MSNHGDPRIVKLCAATNNSSSDEDVMSFTSTTTDGDDDLPTFEPWYRTGTSSPRDDTDHTSLVVEASSSSRSLGDLPFGAGAKTTTDLLPNSRDPSSLPGGSIVPLLGAVEDPAAELSPTQGQLGEDDSKVQCGGGTTDKRSEGSSGMELSISSSNQLEILSNLQAELEETRAALEVTEKQLTEKMDENDEAAEEICKAWGMVRELQTDRSKPALRGQKNSELLLHILRQIEQEGAPEGAWLCREGLEGALVHLYVAREDAVREKKLAQEQLQEISQRYKSLQGKLHCFAVGLQGLLGKPREEGSLTFDREVTGQEETAGSATAREERCFTLLEQLKGKLQSQESAATRWQMMTCQLRRELEHSRQRCEAKMETLCRAEQECRRRTEEAESQRRQGIKQERLIQALTAKMAECDRENAASRKIHSELEGRISRLSEQLQKTLQEHEVNLQCQQKVGSLEEELKIARATCNELWERQLDTASQLASKTTQCEELQKSSSSDGSDAAADSVHVDCCHDDASLNHDAPVGSNALEEIHEQFATHMSLVEELEAERHKSYQLRNVRLASEESACLDMRTELSKEREALQEGQKQQEMAKQKLEEERRSREERVQKMTESLLEASRDRGHLTSDLSQSQYEAEKFGRQLVAASTALEYEKNARETLQVKLDKTEEQVAQMQRQLAMLQQDCQLTNQRTAEAQRLVATVQSERDKYREEYMRATEELKRTSEALQILEHQTSVTMATRELETNAKLTEKAILNSDLSRRLETATGERNDRSEQIRELEAKLKDYDRKVADLQTAKSCCEQLQPLVAQLQSDLATSQSSLQDAAALKQQQEAELDAAQEELNSALAGQAALLKKLRKQKAGSDSALRSLEEEKDVLTNQLAEASNNLTNIQQQLKVAVDSKLQLIQDKQKLRETCRAMEEQRKLDHDELQRAHSTADNLTQQLEEEQKIKKECQERLGEATASLASMEIELKEERLKVTTLSAEVFALRDTTRCQKNQIVELTGQVQELQLELQSAIHTRDLQYNKLMSSSEKTISELEKTCEKQEDQLRDVCKANSKLQAELSLLNNSFSKKRCEYNRALLALHKAEMKEKDMMSAIRQLEGQLDVEKNVQDQLNKSCEIQEAELVRLRATAKNKKLNIEELKNTMECNTKIELQHIKAELTREIISKIETSPPKETQSNADRSKERIQDLEAQVCKLEGLRSVDKLTVASLTEDLNKLQTFAAKQKGAQLKRKSHARPRKDDIKAALARAHARALSMSMADHCYPADPSPLFDSAEWFGTGTASSSSPKKKPSYGCWETKSSDSTTTSSDEYSS